MTTGNRDGAHQGPASRQRRAGRVIDAKVGKTAENLIIRKGKNNLASARLKDVSQLVLCGNVGVSAQTIHLLSEAGVPIVHLSSGHWFHAITYGIGLRNAYDRAAQFAAAAQPNRCLSFAKAVVSAKGSNQRTMLRRNGVLCQNSALLK